MKEIKIGDVEGREREMGVGGAPSPHLLHGEKSSHRVPEDHPFSGGPEPSSGFQGREHRLYGGLAVLHQLGDQVGGEERLLHHLLDERQPHNSPRSLVVLLQDLRQPCVIDVAVVHQQNHLAVEIHDLFSHFSHLLLVFRFRCRSLLHRLLYSLRQFLHLPIYHHTNIIPFYK